jgi:sigma-B regulation protein RsbU (phosphoserine phosphatase)
MRDQVEAQDSTPPAGVAELSSLLDLTTTLGSDIPAAEALDAALGIVLREVQAVRGAFFVRRADGALALGASRDLPPGAPRALGGAPPRGDAAALGPGDEAHDRQGLVLLVPIHRRGRTIAVLGLGPREGGQPYGAREAAYLRRAAAGAASPLESGLLHDELQRVGRRLSLKVLELHNLFDVSRDLAASSAEEAILGLLATTVMGHFAVSRCALYLSGPRGLTLAHGRGLRRETDPAPIPPDETRAALAGLAGPRAVVELPDGPLRRRLEECRLALAVPLAAGERVEGVLAIGERASGTPFTEEDREFADALSRQAVAALENARLQRVREEKLRQDRELQIAREIQQSLFPTRPPEVPGFEVAGESRPCYEVGGDAYDWIPLGDGRLALVVADVAGKGTPASLLMASVHAFLHALAGTASPVHVVERLSRFLFENTQTSRFVTLFYAELDTASRRLAYVNAGHVPPYRVMRDGTVSRLAEGGPALGLLAEASYEAGETRLEPGDVIAVVTDGVTEAGAADEREFGDERVGEALRRPSGGAAAEVLEALVAAVDEWVGAAGCHDDLTALILTTQRREATPSEGPSGSRLSHDLSPRRARFGDATRGPQLRSTPPGMAKAHELSSKVNELSSKAHELRSKADAPPPGAQGGTSACSMGVALSFVRRIRLAARNAHVPHRTLARPVAHQPRGFTMTGPITVLPLASKRPSSAARAFAGLGAHSAPSDGRPSSIREWAHAEGHVPERTRRQFREPPRFPHSAVS